MSSAKRRILVVGYPKSGTTWVTRLTAQLLGAPVKGFWNEPAHKEIAVEGLTRVSHFEVYKGHQTYGSIRGDFGLADVVYVVRDVRDVALSCAGYFKPASCSLVERVARSVRLLRRSSVRRGMPDRRDRQGEMIRMLAEGDSRVSAWCAPAWDHHIQEYIEAGAFMVKYERLLASPEHECQRLLDHLRVKRSTKHIRASVEAQSFSNAKRRFAAQGDRKRAGFLRQGRAGAWCESLGWSEEAYCRRRFAAMLARLGYAQGG